MKRIRMEEMLNYNEEDESKDRAWQSQGERRTLCERVVGAL